MNNNSQLTHFCSRQIQWRKRSKHHPHHTLPCLLSCFYFEGGVLTALPVALHCRSSPRAPFFMLVFAPRLSCEVPAWCPSCPSHWEPVEKCVTRVRRWRETPVLKTQVSFPSLRLSLLWVHVSCGSTAAALCRGVGMRHRFPVSSRRAVVLEESAGRNVAVLGETPSNSV